MAGRCLSECTQRPRFAQVVELAVGATVRVVPSTNAVVVANQPGIRQSPDRPSNLLDGASLTRTVQFAVLLFPSNTAQGFSTE